jgi:hypothetical protein
LLFAISIERRHRCGGRLNVFASIEEPALIERILAHLERRADDGEQPRLAIRLARTAAAVALLNPTSSLAFDHAAAAPFPRCAC